MHAHCITWHSSLDIRIHDSCYGHPIHPSAALNYSSIIALSFVVIVLLRFFFARGSTGQMLWNHQHCWLHSLYTHKQTHLCNDTRPLEFSKAVSLGFHDNREIAQNFSVIEARRGGMFTNDWGRGVRDRARRTECVEGKMEKGFPILSRIGSMAVSWGSRAEFVCFQSIKISENWYRPS